MKALQSQLYQPNLFKIDTQKENIGKIPKDSIQYLPFLQDKLKRDKVSYQTEFNRILPKLAQTLDKIKQNPTDENQQALIYLKFFSQVTFLFDTTLHYFPKELVLLLEQYYDALNPTLRIGIVQALVLMTKRGQISHQSTIPLLFKLFRCHDKQLRKLIYSKIIGQLKFLNKNKKAASVNKSLQNFVYQMLEDKNYKAARKSLQVTIDLYRKNIWNDAKTVNVIAQGCTHKYPKIARLSCEFLLDPHESTNKTESEDQDDQDNINNPSSKKHLIQALSVLRKKHRGKTKFTKKQKEKMERQMQLLERRDRRKSKIKYSIDFMPIDLINDPSGLAERLYKRLKKASDKFPTRLSIMKVIARLIGRHHLIIPQFHSYIAGKYLSPKQPELAQILALLAESCHNLVPPDELRPIIQKLIDNYSNERVNTPLQITIALNCIREIVLRVPLSVELEHIQYLTAFRNYKHKSVRVALKGVINLLRDINPDLLDKKLRGRIVNEEQAKKRQEGENSDSDDNIVYGREKIMKGVDGAELLKALRGGGDTPIDQEEILDNEDLKRIRYLKTKEQAQRHSHRLKRAFGGQQEGKKQEVDQMEELERMVMENEFDQDMKESQEEEENDAQLSEVQQMIKFDEEDQGNAQGDDDELNLDSEEDSYIDMDEDDENDEQNPHGFLDSSQLDTYKRTKRQKLEDQQKEYKKFGGIKQVKAAKRKLKSKGSHHESKTEKSHLKNKPMAMVMPKKKIQLHEKLKSVKQKLKQLKTQTGKVKQGKIRVKKKRIS